MPRIPDVPSILRAVALCCALVFLSGPAAAQSAGPPVIYLNQAWSQQDREWYYHFDQGSPVMSYDIFLNLEIADSQELFRSDANSERYGLIPQPPSPYYNPDGLPVGISKTVIATAKWKGALTGDFAGVTCAMCHNSELHYKGKRLRIDGGNNHTLDFQGYIRALDVAMQATLKDPAKFDRLAARLKATGANAKAQLRARFEPQAAPAHYYATMSLLSPSAWGPARIDAFTEIQNRVTSILPQIPENLTQPIAPVKPPFLWNAPHGTWTQWGASAANPIGRNFGEAAGVFMDMNLTAASPAEGLFLSAHQIPNLQRVENQLERLAPPSWPEEIFGKIDRDKARVGKVLFVNNCASCHNAWPYRWTAPNKYGKSFLEVGLIPVSYMGTDTAQLESLRPLSYTGHLADHLPPAMRGEALLPATAMRLGVIGAVLERALSEVKMTDAEKLALFGYRELPSPPSPDRVWKGAPRDGVWATAPFLHNGSVPNLYEMLIPARERTKTFYMGREFDPVKVGVDTSGQSGGFLLDTALLGNSNAGHSFEDGPTGNGVIGPLLTDEERWALVEYLKSIPETPGRVTPFGGP
jgi:hypothetical protein